MKKAPGRSEVVCAAGRPAGAPRLLQAARARCVVNGRAVDLPLPALADAPRVLRDELHLTGSKEGCGHWGVRSLHGDRERASGGRLPPTSPARPRTAK